MENVRRLHQRRRGPGRRALLADEGKTDADDATKASRGREAMQAWMGENNADVNPRYGIGIANGTFTDVDNDTSYPLSANAVAAGQEPNPTRRTPRRCRARNAAAEP